MIIFQAKFSRHISFFFSKMSTRRLRYNSSMNGTDYDNMSMESLRARRAEIEAKRRQLEALDQQRMRDRTSLSSADYMTLKRTRAKIKKQSEIAFRRNQELTHAYDDLLQKHTHVIEDRTYLSRALARYKVCHDLLVLQKSYV